MYSLTQAIQNLVIMFFSQLHFQTKNNLCFSFRVSSLQCRVFQLILIMIYFWEQLKNKFFKMQMLHYSIDIGPSPALHSLLSIAELGSIQQYQSPRPHSFAHASRVFSNYVFFNSVFFVADQLKGGQQKYVMQMKNGSGMPWSHYLRGMLLL